MIRVFVCMKKLAHLSDEQFHAYWRHPHVTLTMRMTQSRRYVVVANMMRVDLEEYA